MKVMFANPDHKVLCEYVTDHGRVPVKGDYVTFRDYSGTHSVYEEMSIQVGIVEKVMLDYIQDIAIVTVKET